MLYNKTKYVCTVSMIFWAGITKMNAEGQGGRDEEYGFGTKTSMIWTVTAKWQSLEII